VLAEVALRKRIEAMTHRVASDLEGTVFADKAPRAFRPHLLCRWTLDPASHRLSCAWAATVEGVVFLSSRSAAPRLSA
jgi:hypothetical protein